MTNVLKKEETDTSKITNNDEEKIADDKTWTVVDKDLADIVQYSEIAIDEEEDEDSIKTTERYKKFLIIFYILSIHHEFCVTRTQNISQNKCNCSFLFNIFILYICLLYLSIIDMIVLKIVIK